MQRMERSRLAPADEGRAVRRMARMWIVLAVLGLLAAVMPIAAAAPPAQSGPVERFQDARGYFYWGDGHLAIVGSSIPGMCADEPFSADAMAVSSGNGGTQFRMRGDVPVLVFADDRFDSSDPNIGFQFLDEVCGMGAPYDLVASGDTVRLRVAETISADGTVHSENSLVGTVTTASGKKAHLTTHASVVFDGMGLIKLNPFFVRYTG